MPLNDPQVAATGMYDPARRSWVESSNLSDADFPIQNLPFGVFSVADSRPRPGIAIGDSIFDIEAALDAKLFSGKAAEAAEAARGEALNDLLDLHPSYLVALRAQTADLLDSKSGSDAARRLESKLVRDASMATMHLPVVVRNYTDFFAGIYHADAVGKLIHKDGDSLPANYKWVPIAYHGRASSIRVSGGDVLRPSGQILQGETPSFGRCRNLDLELELGFFVARGNRLGEPIAIDKAKDHIAGYCLLNDWSARDIQRWEMYPLGPFLGKNFSTSVSPWIVTAEALAPFRLPAMQRDSGDPRPLDYLHDDEDQRQGGLNIDLEVQLQTERMRTAKMPAVTIIRSNSRYLYWTPAQMVAHHTIGGCNLVSGDLIGSGTISGPQRDQLSSLVELTFGGREPFALPNGETRSFLEDGDEIIFRGRCNRPGFSSIGFGTCAGRIA